jgi:hypothetical protein
MMTAYKITKNSLIRIYTKNKEQGQNKLVRIHSPRCSSLYANISKPSRWLKQGHGGQKNIIAALHQGWQDWRLSPCRTQAQPPLTAKDKGEMNQQKNLNQRKTKQERVL